MEKDNKRQQTATNTYIQKMNSCYSTFSVNFLDQIYQDFISWINGLPFSHVGLFIRCSMLLAFPFIFCGVSRILGSKSVFVQIVICLTGLMTGFLIPIENFQNIDPTAQSWITVFAILTIIGLPHPKGLPSLIHPWRGPQRIISYFLYVFLAAILTIGMLKG